MFNYDTIFDSCHTVTDFIGFLGVLLGFAFHLASSNGFYLFILIPIQNKMQYKILIRLLKRVTWLV